MIAKIVLISFLVSAAILDDSATAAFNGNLEDRHRLTQHQLRKRFSSADSHGYGPDTQRHPAPNRRTGFDSEGSPEFYPDDGHTNSNSGSNVNRGSSGGYGRQSGVGFNSQSNGGKPNQGGSRGNSNRQSNQGSNGGSSGQNGAASSTQSTGGSNNQASQSKTTQRAPLNIILNENTMDNSTVRECIQKRCPSTNEYNPVCGDDNFTYQNPSKFKCAQICKSGVKMSYRGSCVTTPSPN